MSIHLVGSVSCVGKAQSYICSIQAQRALVLATYSPSDRSLLHVVRMKVFASHLRRQNNPATWLLNNGFFLPQSQYVNIAEHVQDTPQASWSAGDSQNNVFEGSYSYWTHGHARQSPMQMMHDSTDNAVVDSLVMANLCIA